MKQWEKLAPGRTGNMPRAAVKPAGKARPVSAQVPSEQAMRWLAEGVDAPVQRIHVDAGYGDLIETAKSGASPNAAPCPTCAANHGQSGAAKASCKQGCAQRWGQDTTCSKWGFRAGEAEHAPQFVAKADPPKHPKAVKDLLSPCCNTWPFAVEDHARRHLGLNGAASCPAQHEREVATVGFGGKQVQVLCSDTIPGGMVGTTADPKSCNGKLTAELLEMSPKAMQDLSGQIGNALHVDVCFSGTKQDMCGHDGPGKASFPEATDCVTRGCAPDPDLPKLKDTGWPRS